jgi:hypothetical protein
MSKKAIAAVAILATVMLVPILNAAEAAVGVWEFKSQWPGMKSQAKMEITKSAEGKYEGTWSSQWGESKLSEITFENNKMKFVQTVSFGGGEMKTTYEGTVTDGKIIGEAEGPWGDFTFEGTQGGEAKDEIVGEWYMNITAPAREIVEKLTITENADGTLVGKWEARVGENTISDVKFKDGKLTFTRIVKFGDREFTMMFAGDVEGDDLKGVFSSERGDREANATRVTAAEGEEGKAAKH